MSRVGTPVVSPDRTMIAFSSKAYDFEAHKWSENIYLLDARDAIDVVAPQPRQVTTSRHQSNNSPVFSPNSKHIAFLSNRTGSVQVRVRSTDVGAQSYELTQLPIDVANVWWGADNVIYFACSVFPSPTPQYPCEGEFDTISYTAAAEKALKEGGLSCFVFTDIPVRNWDETLDEKRVHIFSLPVIEIEGKIVAARHTDLMPAVNSSCPQPPFRGNEDFAVSPTHYAFSYRPAGTKDEAWSTNKNIYIAPRDSPSQHVSITEDNKGYDHAPTFSPDGSKLAWTRMRTPQYEADKVVIVIYTVATGQSRVIGNDWEQSPDNLRWSHDGKHLLADMSVRAHNTIIKIDVETGAYVTLAGGKGSSSSASIIGAEAEWIVFSRSDLSAPAELFIAPYNVPFTDAAASTTQPKQITRFNTHYVKALQVGEASEFTFPGANGDHVHAWLIKPVAFDASKTYPLAVVIHGGPQGVQDDSFHYRWSQCVCLYEWHSHAAQECPGLCRARVWRADGQFPRIDVIWPRLLPCYLQELGR